jgi:nucleotide-binding universal stress UspA family protein
VGRPGMLKKRVRRAFVVMGAASWPSPMRTSHLEMLWARIGAPCNARLPSGCAETPLAAGRGGRYIAQRAVPSVYGERVVMPYKAIVVGTDGSERATVAVDEAFALAKMAGATLHAVHVVHPAIAAGFHDSVGTQIEIDRLRRQAGAIRERTLAEAERLGVPIAIHNPGSNDAAEALIKIAEEVNADLVVVGNRGMSGVTRFVLGSVPNKVAHHCPCSVLIVNTEPG